MDDNDRNTCRLRIGLLTVAVLGSWLALGYFALPTTAKSCAESSTTSEKVCADASWSCDSAACIADGDHEWWDTVDGGYGKLRVGGVKVDECSNSLRTGDCDTTSGLNDVCKSSKAYTEGTSLSIWSDSVDNRYCEGGGGSTGSGGVVYTRWFHS